MRGLSAITINAHASEVASCTFEEQERVLAITMDEIGGRIPVVHGVYADGSLEAARIARMARARRRVVPARVSAEPARRSARTRGPRWSITHFKTIADASDLPIICFQYPLASGLGLSGRHADEARGCGAHACARSRTGATTRCSTSGRSGCSRACRARSTCSRRTARGSSARSCSAATGLLSGSGSVIADLQAALFQAVQANDLARARQLNDRIFPIAQAFYADPFVDMHNRMKEALVILGRIPCAAVRPPLVKISDAEIARDPQSARQTPKVAPRRGAAASRHDRRARERTRRCARGALRRRGRDRHLGAVRKVSEAGPVSTGFWRVFLALPRALGVGVLRRARDARTRRSAADAAR